MALVPVFLISPNTILSIIGFIRGQDKTIPTPREDWTKATVNVIIPAHNEHYTISLCLASIMNQTVKPKNIILIDDGSNDETAEYVRLFCEANQLDVKVISRRAPIGKTPTIKRQAREFEADVEFILDGDTVLESPNYIERCVEELYKGVGIASACGVIRPLEEKLRVKWYNEREELKKFLESKPDAKIRTPYSFSQNIQQMLANLYRSALYTFLQKFLYIGQMKLFGSITNPVGCAVAYRQKYVKDLFDKYEPLFGDDLTNSEDIFIGFALLNEGYRNIQVPDVYAKSREPLIYRIPKQAYLWSSSFLQSCFYFPKLLFSPFKAVKRWRQNKRNKRDFKKEGNEKRKIAEAYRQRFGVEWTNKYGRPIGWVVLFSLIEKIGFSLIFWLFIIMGWWLILGITIILETLFSISILCIITKGERWKYFLKGIAVTPIRYLAVLTDIYSVIHFALEAWVFKYRQWRK